MKVLAVTGTRADWGLLLPVLARLRDDPRFDLRLCVTGQHLDPATGSLEAIGKDGFGIDHLLDMGLEAEDSPAAIARAMGRCTGGMGDVLEAEAPDMVLVLGDRYEILAAVSAALVARVPVAHLCGGDVTHGAFDDAIRHAITKMSSLHFVTNADAARRLRQMGEDPARIVTSGSPGIDRLLAEPALPREAFLAEVGLPADTPFLLVSFHPETLAPDPEAQLRALLDALARRPEFSLLLTGSNADPGGREIDRAFAALATTRSNAVFVPSLGSRRYLAALRHAAAVVGNSSSGLYEAPSFATPCVNIGDRQSGRPRAGSVFDCPAESEAILDALDRAVAWGSGPERGGVVNPFGDGQAAERIVEALAAVADPDALVRKTFRDLAA